ncbi:MAG TPA: hypothetical protein VL371_07875 [Gemmataceae bacterium]|nr:hypothetical protein [Gemmataceae bacterium]
MSRRFIAAGAIAALAVPVVAHACSLCGGAMNKLTWRQGAAQAKLILYGTLANPRLGDGNGGAAGTDLQIEHVIKSHPILAGRKSITLPRWLPVDPKSPPKFLVFCDVFNDRLDPYLGTPVKSPAVVGYLTGAMAVETADRQGQLAYFTRYLDHADADVAGDAFLEFAKSNDADVARAAKTLDPARLRKLLSDPQTPAERLSLFAYLLGACGGPADADFFGRLLQQPDERVQSAYGGILAGYVMLRPQDGWKLAYSILGDTSRKYPERAVVVSTLRFFHGTRPDSRREVLNGMSLVLPQGDMADMAIEDLRQWQWWDLTGEVLAQYGKKSHASPLVRRSIVRYALVCPKPEAKQFVAAVRRADPALVKDIEGSLQFEAPVAPGK